MKKTARTRFRTRTRVDMSRVADGLKGPGIDTRTWIAMARVDVDPDATVWDPELGWLVDVTIVGGPLDGDGPVLCRLASHGAALGSGQFDPPHQGCLVVVAIPGGDTNADCIIIGQLNDEEFTAPTTINGVAITEELMARTHVLAFPGHDLDGEFTNVRLTGRVVLAEAAADQAFARGNDLADALGRLADAMAAFVDAAVVPPGTAGNVAVSSFKAAGLVFKNALASFKGARSQYLSTKIKGV